MAVHNDWQLYKMNGGEYDHFRLRRSIATGLLKTYGKGISGKPGQTSHGFLEKSRYGDVGHINKYRTEQLRCAVCHKNAMFFSKNVMSLYTPKIALSSITFSD